VRDWNNAASGQPRLAYFGNETVSTDLYFRGAGLLSERLAQFVFADGVVFAGVEGDGGIGTQLGFAEPLIAEPWIEIIRAAVGGGVSWLTSARLTVVGTDWDLTGTLLPSAGCDTSLTWSASCLLARFNTEPNAVPALTVAVAEFAFSKTDSAAAWARASVAKTNANVRKLVMNIVVRMNLFM